MNKKKLKRREEKEKIQKLYKKGKIEILPKESATL